jgi:hypothetical protein
MDRNSPSLAACRATQWAPPRLFGQFLRRSSQNSPSTRLGENRARPRSKTPLEELVVPRYQGSLE